jgi:hypothetical protein
MDEQFAVWWPRGCFYAGPDSQTFVFLSFSIHPLPGTTTGLGVSSPSSAHGGNPPQFVPSSNCAGCAGMPGVTNPMTIPLIGATSPMPSMPVMPPGSGQVPQVPLAQLGSPSSLGMFVKWGRKWDTQMKAIDRPLKAKP